MRQLNSRDEGATLVTVVVSIFVLLAFLAFAIDGGAAFLDVRRSQSAADNSAMAAALQECSPTTEYTSTQDAAETVAASNQFTIDSYTAAAGRHTVGIETETGFFILPAIPFLPDSLTVNVDATAACVQTPGIADYALFGAGQCGNDTVSVSASDITIGDPSDPIAGGSVYSGEYARFTGSSPVVEGPVFTGGEGNRNEVPGGTALLESYPTQPYPEPLYSVIQAGFGPWSNMGDFGNPGNVVTESDGFDYINFGNADIDRTSLAAAGHLVGNELVTSGVYVTSGDIDLSLAGTDPLVFASGVRATFVSRGYIKIGKAELQQGTQDAYYKPNASWGPGLVLFAWGLGPDPRCGDSVSSSPDRGKGIATASNGLTWTGIIFAPFGEASISAESGSTNSGPIYAHNIDLSGSSYTISVSPDSSFIPTRRVVLVDTSP